MERKEIIPRRVPVRRQQPEERIRNFEEVAYVYSEDEAKAEASRCLGCKKPPCVKGCPVGVDIPGFISKILAQDYKSAIKIIKEQNLLPGVCGRVCPQENQCEKFCILGKKGDPVSIGKLERFAADVEAKSGVRTPDVAPLSGYNAAIVGSGPAGLTCAFELARKGHRVTIFEALHAPGGVLTYGIPEFRLPQEVVDREVKILEKMGVEIKLDFVVGKTAPFDEIASNYHSAFIAIGAGLPLFMGIPGENLNGVYSANEFQQGQTS